VNYIKILLKNRKEKEKTVKKETEEHPKVRKYSPREERVGEKRNIKKKEDRKQLNYTYI